MEMAGNQGRVTGSPASELEELSKESNSFSYKRISLSNGIGRANDSRDLNFDATRLRITDDVTFMCQQYCLRRGGYCD